MLAVVAIARAYQAGSVVSQVGVGAMVVAAIPEIPEIPEILGNLDVLEVPEILGIPV